MEFFDTVVNRHSYRGPFTDQEVNPDDLRKVVQAGLDAPSGMNKQTTGFVIVTDPDLVSRIAAMHDSNKAFQQAKVFIVCLVDAEPEKIYAGCHFQIEDCSAAVENMLLAIAAMGYASVWIDGWLRTDGHAETIGKLLGAPDDKVVQIILPIGVPTYPVRGPEKQPFEQRAWFNSYGG
ncbi:MAG: nitroreductase family protein [Phycisphaerae bacterium]|jgi:nitroreductase|nr:nitroreductase family protein [Phycisphaerae bacterium]